MSVSTDSILCYGFEVGDEDEKPDWMEPQGDDEEFDFETFLVSKFSDSIKDPAEFDKADYDSNPETRKQWSDYWAAKRELVKSVNVDLVSHCSGDYPMYVIAVKASITMARRGYPKKLAGDIVVDPGWHKILEDFCEKTGIPMSEPCWVLCSYWT